MMRTLAALWRAVRRALLLALLTYGVAGLAAEISVETDHRQARIQVRAQASIAAKLSTVWEVITDYENLPKFVPGLRRSVVRRDASGQLELEQQGEADFLFWSIPIEVVLQVIESPPQRIVSSAVRGNVRFMQARYELLPGAVPGRVILRYWAEIEPDFALPPIVGTIALQSNIEAQFTAVVHEIERRAGQAHGVRQ